MVGSLGPFAATVTPLSVPVNPTVAAIVMSSGDRVIDIATDIPIVGGPLNDYGAWLPNAGGPSDTPTTITLVGGGVRIENSSWTGAGWTELVYDHSGGDYVTADGGVLQGFTLPIPTP